MCYEAFLNGDATEKPVARLLREETTAAAKDGVVAAVVVLTVLLAEGTGLALTAGAAVGAVTLGAVLHQAVLVAGVGFLRWREGRADAPAPETA